MNAIQLTNYELEKQFADWCETINPYYAEEYMDCDTLNPQAMKELVDQYTDDKNLREHLYYIINCWIYDILSDFTLAETYDGYLKP